MRQIQIFNFQSADEWRTVFYISSGIYLFGCVVYWFWASGEVQPWARLETSDPDGEDQKAKREKDKEGHVNEAATINE